MAALVDRYRPEFFEELVGQAHVVNCLKRVLKSPDSYPKNFIFNGPYGTGKTTAARIFAAELAKISPTSVYEFDSTIMGNKEGILSVRDRIENVFNFSNTYRVLIFDEIQASLSTAQSVFMTTLENNILTNGRDRNIYFIFVTTDSSRILPQIISRCVELNFYLISSDLIKKRLNEICQKESLEVGQESIEKIVEHCRGHLRDAIVLLDKVSLMGDQEIQRIICDTRRLIWMVLFQAHTIADLLVYPVDILVKDLNRVIFYCVEKWLDEKYLFCVQLLELYMKYKNYITTIEDFISVIKLLQHFITARFNKGGAYEAY